MNSEEKRITFIDATLRGFECDIGSALDGLVWLMAKMKHFSLRGL